MKIPKFFYYFSLIISTIFAVIYYSLLPFVVAMAAVMFFQIPAYFLGPIMFVDRKSTRLNSSHIH